MNVRVCGFYLNAVGAWQIKNGSRWGRHGEMNAKDANAITYACNATLVSIRIDEKEKDIDELEQIIEKIKR